MDLYFVQFFNLSNDASGFVFVTKGYNENNPVLCDKIIKTTEILLKDHKIVEIIIHKWQLDIQVVEHINGIINGSLIRLLYERYDTF